MKLDVPTHCFRWPEAFRERVQGVRHSKDALRAGRELINSGIYRFRAFEPVAIDLFADWTADPVEDRSWQWNSASFNFMPWLIALHENTGDQRALDHAAKAIESWHDQFVLADSDYEFAWHDHATANRLMAVLMWLCHLDDHPGKVHVDALIPEFLAAHGDRLCLDEMYSRYTNHGIDQSRALLLLATCAPWLAGAGHWRKVALVRLEAELEHAFAADGAHVENSPAYHQFVSRLFADVLFTFGDTLEAPFRNRLRDKLVKAARFMAWIVRPDAQLPPIGDTECIRAINVFRPLAGTDEYQHVDWVCTRGEAGKKPEGRSELFQDAGYFVARSDWESVEGAGNATHLVFRCGVLSHYHRHDDDLSLALWWGTDWFLDGGAFSYAEQHPVRRYLRSKWAHNVVVVDDVCCDWDWPPGAMAPGSLMEVSDGGARTVVRGVTQSYPDLHAAREISVESDGMRFEVHDQLSPPEGETGGLREIFRPAAVWWRRQRGAAGGRVRKFRSLWHVPADKSVTVDGQCVRIYDAAFMREVLITNHGEDFDRIEVLDVLPFGTEPVWSRELYHSEPCKIIVFERSGTRFESRLEFQLRDDRPEHRDAGTRNANPRTLFRSYGLDPAAWWSWQGTHHGRKVSDLLEQAGKRGISGEALLEGLFAIAILRRGRHRPTLHLSHMGHLDAGLVEQRLRAALGMQPAREVYLPEPLQRTIRDWPKEERFLFIDAVHLLHAGVQPGPHMFNSVINSSQGHRQGIFWRGDRNAIRVLVLRDPVDAALNALARARPAAGWRERADAESALQHQIERLERFAGWAKRQAFALTFRIEDFARDPAPVLEEIGTLCGSPPDLQALASVPRIKPLSAAQSDSDLSMLHGLPAREILRDRLADTAATLGYA